MEPRELIDKGSLGPNALRVVYQAFDDAWGEIAADCQTADQAEVRTKLALALLAVANNDSRDSRTLKKLALETMAASSDLR